MKQLKVKKWLLEVDVDKTKEFYHKDNELYGCLTCKNYMEASKHLSSPVLEVFSMLGIISSKPSHLSENGEMEDRLHLYIGSYHIVGKLVEGEYCTDSEWVETNTARIQNFTFGFNKELMFVPDELRGPILQLDFEARIPWLLHEKPMD